ncbi:MAG: hypothetical protein M1828_005115 [Chrysothrix sp. TS-e1954]|nr:MAG: hypothetical protein M1828_005115 [Chrysothrix sp. TS-e1954]
MARLNVLVCGAGVGGPSAAYWLAKTGAKVTIVERSPSPRKTGQAVDIRSVGVPVMRKMGLEKAIRACNTTEKGIEKVGAKGEVIVTINSSGDTSQQTITSEFEIARADLARIFTEAVQNDVEVAYGDHVNAIEQRDEKVHVKFANGRPAATYDLVIGADGMGSRTRSLVTGRPAREDVANGNGIIAYFSLPRRPMDSRTHARLYTITKGRSILLRPTREKDRMGCVLTIVNPLDSKLEAAANADVEEQKRFMREAFRDGGWEADRICDELLRADDFYCQREGQVHIDEWIYGRVALLGDAAHAVSVWGTSSAMFGGYVLAGEITKHPNDLSKALASYQQIMRPKVERWQYEPAFMSKVMNPQSQLAINTVNGILKVIFGLKLDKVGAWVAGRMGNEEESIPEYEWKS